jgi:PhnB protein
MPPVKICISPVLRIRNAASSIDFYQKAFGAIEVDRCVIDGEFVRAELKIGDAPFTVAEESIESDSPSPLKLGGSAVSMDLVVPEVDKVVNRAVELGATIQFPVQDQFFGLRQGRIRDPFGHIWSVATPLDKK